MPNTPDPTSPAAYIAELREHHGHAYTDRVLALYNVENFMVNAALLRCRAYRLEARRAGRQVPRDEMRKVAHSLDISAHLVRMSLATTWGLDADGFNALARHAAVLRERSFPGNPA